jgi:hypothetical protein
MLAYVGKHGEPQKGYAGALWALLNSGFRSLTICPLLSPDG